MWTYWVFQKMWHIHRGLIRAIIWPIISKFGQSLSINFKSSTDGGHVKTCYFIYWNLPGVLIWTLKPLLSTIRPSNYEGHRNLLGKILMFNRCYLTGHSTTSANEPRNYEADRMHPELQRVCSITITWIRYWLWSVFGASGSSPGEYLIGGKYSG